MSTGDPPTLVPLRPALRDAPKSLLYHLAYVKNEIGGRTSHYLDFMWPERKAPNWLLRG
jgi:hypothetical protein